MTVRHLDLPAYFDRIGYTGPREATFVVLRNMISRHVAAIPFENIDPFLGKPVDLDPAVLQTKLVRSHRGGYCQEHNALFHDVLAALGFSVLPLAGRVVGAYGGQPAPLTHRLSVVELPEGMFIADVGLGGRTPTEPILMEVGLEHAGPHGTYRATREGEVWELQLRLGDEWAGLYQFRLDLQTPIDFEVANWFTATHPRSRFTQSLTVCRVVGTTRHNLLNTRLSVRQPNGHVETQWLTEPGDLARLLTEVMGLELPAAIEAIWTKAKSQPMP